MNYKKYSLENLETWLYDAMSCGEATPQEIYDVIIKVVKDEYYTYKKKVSESYELLTLLNNNPFSEEVKELGKLWDKEDKILSCDKDDPSPECKGAWNDFWEDTDSSREYNLREAEYYNKRARLDAEYEAIKAAGGYDYTPLPTKDKVVKWQLPVEIDASGEYFVTFPDDLLDAANLKEGDNVRWVDNGNGSYTITKVTKPLGMDEC